MIIAAQAARQGTSVPIDAAHFDCDVMVVGLARNCAGTIEDVVTSMTAAMSMFACVHWYVVESDSDDSTTAALERLRDGMPNFDFVSLGRLRDSIPLRTARIAHCRNAYLREVQARLDTARLKYVVVADLDGVTSLLTETAISSCWSRKDWDVCTANQDGPYYDVWALRHPEWCPGDCFREMRYLRRHGRSKHSAALAAVYAKMLTIPPSADWVAVDSAFGGLAVYRAHLLRGVSYVGLAEDGQEVCEHVSLHQQIRAAGGKIYINPKMINASFTEHSQYWLERAEIAAETYRPLFRAMLRVAFDNKKRQALRRMLDSAS